MIISLWLENSMGIFKKEIMYSPFLFYCLKWWLDHSMTQTTVTLNIHYQPYFPTQINPEDHKFIMSHLISLNHQEWVSLQKHQQNWSNRNVVFVAKIMGTHKLLLAAIRISFEMEITLQWMVKLTIQGEWKILNIRKLF